MSPRAAQLEALRSALEGFPAALAILDGDGLVLTTNAAWRQAVVNNGGWDEDAQAQRYLEACGPADGPEPGDSFAAASGLGAVLSGGSQRFVLPYRCRSSLDERPFRLIISALPPPLGGALVIHQELAATAPQPVAGADAMGVPLHLLEQAPVLLWFADADQRCRWFNQRWHEFAGTTPGSDADAQWNALIHPADLAPSHPGLPQDLLARRAGARTLRLRRQDGSYRWMLAAMTPLDDGHGGCTGYLGSCTDITELTDAEAELQRQRERLERELHFAAALNRLSQLISGLGERDQLLDALSLLLGKALGLDRSLIFDVDLQRRQALALSEWLNPSCPLATTVKRDYPLALFPESLRHLWEMRVPLESHRDQPNPRLGSEGSAGLLHDGMEIHSLLWLPIDFRADGFLLVVLNQVSQRRVWQAEERRFLDAVANLVTLALQRIRITDEHRRGQERRRLGERVAAMAQVASCAGLELERALAAIGGAVEALTAVAGGAGGQLEQVQAIERAIAGARRTGSQLLGLSRCRAQRPQPLAAGAVIDRLATVVDGLSGESGEIARRHAWSVPDEVRAIQLRADPLLLDQALRSLAGHLHRALLPAAALAVSAARHALDPATARRLGLEAGDHLAIVIAGPARGPMLSGIAHAFDALTATQAYGDGPDLDLISAAAIIGCMDGGLAAGAAAGPCTAFTVYLPLATALDAAQAATPLRLTALGGRETVLLVEDDPVLFDLLGDSLRHLGYQLLAASTGEEALQLAERHAGGIDLLLTDVVLPQLGGHELAVQLVQLRKDLRVVLMSGFPADAFRANREFAHAAFLAKPFTIDELARTVRTALDAGRTAAG